jgi:hypothetical protein
MRMDMRMQAFIQWLLSDTPTLPHPNPITILQPPAGVPNHLIFFR